jgi:hypothetical protein
MGLAIKFVNQSLGATSFLWTFGDGSASAQENPLHTYATGGVYIATLKAIGPAGVSYASRPVYPAGQLFDVLMGTAVGDVLASADGSQIAIPPPPSPP